MRLPPVATSPVLLGSLWAVALWVAPGLRAQVRPIPPESDDSPPIRVVAYNLRNWLSLERRVDGEFVTEAPKPEAEKSVAVRMLAAAKPDVVGVCEIGTAEDLADLQARLRVAGIDLPEAHWHRGADDVRRLGLLSRFPISRREPPREHTYVLDGRTLRFQRGILDVTLQITSDYELRLLGTHLKSRREVEEGDQAAIRRHEAVLLRQYVESILLAQPGTNLLVYGDFNDTKNEQTIKVVQGRFGDAHHLRDLWLEDADGHRFTYYWNVADTYDRIDFAFVSQGLWPEIDSKQSFIVKDPDWLKASDHRPLVISVHPHEAGTKAKR